MTTGTLVRFATPQNDDEKAAIMSVVEDRGDRVLVTDTRFADWRVRPTAVYPKSDLVASA